MTRLLYSVLVHVLLMGLLLELRFAAAPAPVPRAAQRITLLAPPQTHLPTPRIPPARPPAPTPALTLDLQSRFRSDHPAPLEIPLPAPSPAREPVLAAVIEPVQARTFAAPTVRRAPLAEPARAEILETTPLPLASVPAAPQRTEVASTRALLPPPPVTVGRLTGAVTAAPPDPAPMARAQAAGFGGPVSASPSISSDSHTLRTAAFASAAATSNPASLPQTAPGASGFGDARIATAGPTRTSAPEAPKLTPVEILSKPPAVYTAEARALRLEGEVALEVLFSASGRIQVLRVLSGLGHGLDEAASDCAAHIQFRPARQSGQSVDQTATVRIRFRLAY